MFDNIFGYTLHKVVPNPIRVKTLNDGTDGFRFETPGGQQGIVRFTNKNEPSGEYKESRNKSNNKSSVMSSLKGGGARLYWERKNVPAGRHLWGIAG